MSGRHFDLLDPFCPPECNEPYLGGPGDAAEAIAVAFENADNSVERLDYIAALYNYDDDTDGQDDRFGLLQLVTDLEWVFNNWIDGVNDPTRIVIVAHSHGCVWAHIACSVVPHVPIDYLISLDGNCLDWGASYGQEVADYLATNGNPFPWDISNPCDVWVIFGVMDPADTEDVAFDNVAVNLEVRSADFLISDFQVNHRLDGSFDGIFTYDAVIDDHSGVHDPLGESMAWVLDQLALPGY